MSGASAAFSGGGGASGGGGGTPTYLDSQTITTGVTGVMGSRQRGFIAATSLGSCADATSNLYAGAAIRELYHDEDSTSVIFTVTGVQVNSGWTNMNIVGAVSPDFVRSSALFSTAGGNSSWTWPSTGSPFGGSGTVRTVNFT